MNQAEDIVLVLKPLEGKKALSSTGLMDARLFTGENSLHVTRDPQTHLWGMHMTAGNLPLPLRQKFTSWGKLFNFTKDYLGRRNINITEVQD